MTGNMIWQQKLDGVRAVISADRIVLRTTEYRNGGITVPEGCVLDGELLAKSGNFYDVVPAVMKKKWDRLFYIPFDILQQGEKDLHNLSLVERLTILHNICPDALGVWAYPNRPMPKVPQEWEGVVGKPLGSRYTGTRSSWIKWKNIHMLEATLLGYEQGRGDWSGMVGKVVFGTSDGTRLGVAAGFDAKMQRTLTLNGEQFIGKSVLIRHYGINKTKFRNPVFHGIKDI